MSGVDVGLIVAAAALLSAGLILATLPVLRRLALAHPNARSSHRTPTPQGGGLAVVIATVAAAALAVTWGGAGSAPGVSMLGFVIAATAFVALVGAVDDIRTIEVAPRLALQALAVGLVIASLPAELRVAPFLPWWMERLLLAVAGLWFVNLTNFMDGLDWMTVAEVVPVTAGLAVIGLLGGLPPEAVAVALALCGAMLGFAPFNRPVARLFLGDVGSLPIGLLLGWMLMLLAGNGHWAAALLLPLYYLADATLTLARRMLKGERFWEAHRSHYYQRATDLGWSVRDIVGRVFAVNGALAALAVVSITAPGAAVVWVCLAAGGLLVAMLLRGFARGRRPAPV